MKIHSEEQHRSPCPIATSLDVLGDSWTLVLIRDLLNGKTKFKEFLESPERITSSVLTARLTHMIACGLISKTPYQQRPVRFAFTLTPKGEALRPALQEMCKWANYFYPYTWVPPDTFMEQVK